MKIHRRSALIWIGVHLAALIAILLFPLYRRVAELATLVLSSCVLHDRFHLYCPLCGGTRAIGAILSGDLLAALTYNPFVTLLLVLLIVWDILALIRLLRGQRRIFALPTWVWITLISVTLAYGLLRNILMIAIGYDPLGDLIGFWHAV